jgi:O-acetyl-ADP-ribose deacetylase (regulator of RNase III)
MIKYVKGNLLDSDCDYICHQVNCQGVMGSGVARQIRERWPRVYESYRHFVEYHNRQGEGLLGKILISNISNPTRVINMFSQDTYGYDGNRYTSYDAFANCLREIDLHVASSCSIGFPKNIGCGLGGGNWAVISALIEEILGHTHDVYIYELEGA